MTSIRLLLAAALASAPALAIAGDWSIGVRAGGIAHSLDAEELRLELAKRGHTVTTTLTDPSSMGGIYGLWRMNDKTSLELGWVFTGETELALSGSTPDAAQLAEDATRLLSGRGHSAWVGVRAELPTGSSRLLFTPRFGAILGQSTSEISVNGANVEENVGTFGFGLGLGLNYRFTKRLTAGFGWELMRLNNDASASALFGNLEWRI